MTRMKISAFYALALLSISQASPVAAQPFSSDRMMGPGMMGRGMMGAGLCDPRAAGLAEWRIRAMERNLRPNDAQRAALDALKSASAKAAETISNACPRELPASPVARLEIMETRLAAMLDALKIVRPAFEKFYNSLSDEQKTQVNAIGPRRWGWREKHWPWNR